MMKYKVDLNADLGEGIGADEELIPLLTSANIACGYHAGDARMMLKAVEACIKVGVNIGAHPSYPDRENFGRTDMHLTPREVRADMWAQLGTLDGICQAVGGKMVHVKPHGSLYNMAFNDADLARVIVDAIKQYNPELMLFAQPYAELAKAGEAAGLKVVYEVFADRAYNDDGSLVSRKLPGSVLSDAAEVKVRTLRMITEQKVETYSGKILEFQAGTVCLHGDNPEALALARALRQGLIDLGVEIVSPK